MQLISKRYKLNIDQLAYVIENLPVFCTKPQYALILSIPIRQHLELQLYLSRDKFVCMNQVITNSNIKQIEQTNSSLIKLQTQNQNNQMDQIFNDPIISNFLQSIKQSDKKATLKELILLGISAVSSKLHAGCCCSNVGALNRIRSAAQCVSFSQCACKCTFVPNIARVFQTGGQWTQSMISQIQRMKNRINQLQSYINNPGPNKQVPQFVYEGQNIRQNLGTTQTQTQAQDKKQLNAQPQVDLHGIKKQFRHHLDDSQVRKALINPYAKNSPVKQKRKQRKQQIDKKHLMQKQRDEQQLRKIRTKNQMGSLGGGGIGGMHANINQQNDQESEQFQKQRINSKSKSKSKEKQKDDRSNNIHNVNNINYKFKSMDDKSQGKNSRNALNQLLAEQNVHTINTISSKQAYNQNRSHQISHKNSTIVNNATSKIKSLIQRDKNRSRNHKNLKNSAFMRKSVSRNTAQEKYCQFQYSDQEQYSQEQQSFNNNQKQNDAPCPIHNTTGKQSSSFSQHSVSGFMNEKQQKKAHQKSKNTKQFKNTYKQTRKKIKETIKHQSEQEQQDDEYRQNNQIDQQSKIQKQDGHQSDAVSQSSSFSKFSLSSRRDRERQTGKISGLRKN